MALTTLQSSLSHNVATFRRQPLAEISGALGDLGTFLPIVIALTGGHQISLTTTLVFTGLFNILTGLVFGIPLPVQPMKAIAAVAILKHLSAGEVAAAGIFVSACILLFSITGLLHWFTNIIPIPVVKGIQVGAGLSLIIAAGSKATSGLSWLRPSWADNYIWLIVAFIALVLTQNRPETPYAFVAFLVGIAFAVIRVNQSRDWNLPHFHLWHIRTRIPLANDWRVGIIDAGVGQLPLTTLNSIVAVTYLAADLLPDVTTPSVTSIGMSVAAMNLFGCWFGSMPVCHGSGGLAAQYRFGARSGASIIFLGLFKLLIGLLFGESLKGLLHLFPNSFLTVMIIAAGLELAGVGESLNTGRAPDVKVAVSDEGRQAAYLTEEQRKQRWTTMLVTAGVLVAFKNDAIGFLAGMLCHWSYELPRYGKVLRDRFNANREGDERRPLLPP